MGTRGRFADLLLLAVAFAALHLPGLGRRELFHEEGRRVMVAREMAASGDWVVPRLWGHTYLTKPPGYYASVAAVGTLTGEVGATSARLVSFLATLGSTLLVYALGRRLASRAAGLSAAGLYLCAPLVFEKSGLGEIEALFGFLLLAGMSALLARGRGWLVPGLVAGLLLGAALLTKGPAAWVFFAPFLAGMAALGGEERTRALRGGGLALLLSLGLFGLWMVAVSGASDGAAPSAWREELLGEGFDPATYALQRLDYLGGFVGGALPLSIAVAVGLLRWREWPADRRTRTLTTLAGLAPVAFFLLYPRAAARYAYPALPWLAVSAGLLVGAATYEARVSRAAGEAHAWTVRGMLGLGAVAAAGMLALPWLEVERLAELELGAPSLVLGALLLLVVASAALLGVTRRRVATLVLAFAGFALGRTFYLVEILPHMATREGVASRAEGLSRALPADGPLWTSHWGGFNVLAHLDREITFTRTPEELAPGSRLIAAGSGAPQAAEGGWSVLFAEREVDQPLVVLQRAP